MLRVGLTGGIGSGKSVVAAMLRDLGCFVSQSDEVARSMMQPGEALYASIVDRFGQGVLQPDGTLDRGALARIAFQQGGAEPLNRIVHPAVIAWQTAWLQQMEAEHPDGVAVIESALIFETKHGDPAGSGTPWRRRFNRVVLVTAPEPLRIRRYVDRYIARADASSKPGRAAVEADARARIAAQLPDREKLALVDMIIENAGTLHQLRQRVTEVWQDLRKQATGPAR